MAALTAFAIAALIRRDACHWRVLGVIAALDLPGGCVGAGFVRNLVWDHLHGRRCDCRQADVDVLYFDPVRTDPARDAAIEARLRDHAPGVRWSVKNQARMHLRNGDAPYASVTDAMRSWPETATAVAARRTGGACTVIAPFGTDDLAGMILRPTAPAKLPALRERLAAKNWRSRWRATAMRISSSRMR
jgi:uncharacterized protein